jgi:hypothetical protein
MGLLPGFAALFQQRISILEGTNENTDWPHFDAEKLFGYLELLERAGRFDSRHLGLHIPNSSPAETNAVLGFLRREIVHIYGTPVDSAVLSAKAPHRALLHVLDAFHPVGDPMAVFTTNYDLILEQVLQEKDLAPLPSGGTLRVCTGFSAERQRRWLPELFDDVPQDGERLVQVVKLHGSATWKMDRDGLIDTNWGMPTDYDRLLYFGYKTIPEEEPFITLHNILKKALLHCDAVVAVGFRFGDPYIRDLFDFALRMNASLRVLCCLTKPPERGSHLRNLMDRFPSQVMLLTDHAGNAMKFGDPGFADALRDALTDSAKSRATA